MEEKDKALVNFVLIDYKKCDRVEDFAATEERSLEKKKYDGFWLNEEDRHLQHPLQHFLLRQHSA
jgi:hypothetical protein